MYTNLREQVNNHFDNELNKFTNNISQLTNGEALKTWYYTETMTDAAFKEVKNSPAEQIISETVKKKMLKRFNNENEKSRNKYLYKLERAEQVTAPENVTITVTWCKNKTWGYNPTAEVIGETNRTTGTASGCGYDISIIGTT